MDGCRLCDLAKSIVNLSNNTFVLVQRNNKFLKKRSTGEPRTENGKHRYMYAVPLQPKSFVASHCFRFHIVCHRCRLNVFGAKDIHTYSPAPLLEIGGQHFIHAGFCDKETVHE